MDSLKLGIIKIIYAALTGNKQELPCDFDLSRAARIAKVHSISPIFYYGATTCGVSQTETVMQELFMQTCVNITLSQRQMHELNQLFCTFDQQDIDYMPLKGTLIKALYPKPEMRSMGDADVLIRTEQYGKIKPVVQNLGFKEIAESQCELIWDKPGALHLELHKAITPPNVEDFYWYFGTGWDKANHVKANRYELSVEDHFLFVFTHFARHYRSGGIGIKHMVDIWLYNKAYPSMDCEYIEKELKKLKLYDFYLNVCETLKVWFEEKEPTAVSDFITETIFDNGAFGKRSNEILSEAVKNSKKSGSAREAKTSKIIWLIFLPYKAMCIKYPFLKKAPFLLPVMWVVRGLSAILFKRKKISDNFTQVKNLDQEQIEMRRQALSFVGLEFNAKE